ncbi:MAG: hypothetical protein ACJ789_05630 [Thermomicrobiales bacterium]
MKAQTRKPVSPERRAFLQQIAGLGGQETARRYGNQWFREIGKIGFQALADNRFQGDRKKAMNSLVGRGKRHRFRIDWQAAIPLRTSDNSFFNHLFLLHTTGRMTA